MQQVIQEILKTEEDCARRLEEQRKAVDRRRAEIEAENSERVRAFREQAEAKSAEALREYQSRVHVETENAIARAREEAERELTANQTLLDRIVQRIVDLVVDGDR